VDVVILAGGKMTPEDPLCALTGVSCKALLPIAGKPMIQYVVEAIAGSPQVERFIVVGLSPESSPNLGMPVIYTPARESLLDNVLVGLEKLQEINSNGRLAILSSADIPLLTTEMINWFIKTCTETDHDVYYTVVERQVMERRFPQAGRTFVPLRGGAYCGGDIFMMRTDLICADRGLIDRLMEARKNFWKQVQLLGLGILLRFVLRRLTVFDAEQRLSKRFNLRGRVITTPFAEMGMDVDKPHQFEIVRAELEAPR